MNKVLMFASAKEARFGKVLRFVIPVYLTSLFNTLYTIVDGVFVSAYVGTDALAAVNIAYPIVNLLTAIALAFATGGAAKAALLIGGGEEEEAAKAFSASAVFALLLGGLFSLLAALRLDDLLSLLGAGQTTIDDCRIYAVWQLAAAPLIILKDLFVYFIRADGSPLYSFLTALAGGVCNLVLDYLWVARFGWGMQGAAAATVLGIFLSCAMGVYYFAKRKKILHITLRGLTVSLGMRCMINGASEFVDQGAIAIVTVVFNRAAMALAGEDGVAAVSIIMYLQFLVIGIYFGFSMGISPPLGYAYGGKKQEICEILETYARRFFSAAPIVLYLLTYLLAPWSVAFFAPSGGEVHAMAVEGMRLYGLGFLFSGFNIFRAIRLTTYGKGRRSGILTFLRSFALPLLFLAALPSLWGMKGLWLAVPFAECLTFLVGQRRRASNEAGCFAGLRKWRRRAPTGK